MVISKRIPQASKHPPIFSEGTFLSLPFRKERLIR
jgi:hypothetical protein